MAQAELGSSLHDVEIGNEPELYDTNFFQSMTFPAYVAEVDAYRTAIRSVDPGVKFAGPDFYLTGWLSQYAATKTAGPPRSRHQGDSHEPDPDHRHRPARR